MSKSVPTEPEVQATPDAPVMNMADMMKLFAAMSAEQMKPLVDALAAGLKDVNKPYVDPKNEENERMFREQTRRQMDQERENKHAFQRNCPHIAGCNPLSEARDIANRTSIIWHRLDSTDVQGICTNCQRIFRDDQPDYAEWRQKPSFNRQSASGQRDFLDPKAARERARA